MAEDITTIEIEDMITVGTLAERLSIPVSRLIGELMKNGVMATVNERIDFDTAEIIVEELQLGVQLSKSTVDASAPAVRVKAEASAGAPSRPPVVAVMGHVDHGKTSLLDAIRGAHVVDREAGGITQHISAYQVEHGDRKITFLDTPGHEAFAAIREHGALLTDIVIIVVAADDGIKPQTIEAIRFARKAGVKIIVAANKMDKDGADINRLYSELAEQDLMWDGWKGGDTPVLPVSAKTKQGIPELLDMVILVTDVEELKADTDVPARGLIIEAHVEQGRGPVAHALVEAGTLKPGDFVVAGSSYAKIRNLETTDGKPLKQALPSTPVAITGFKTLPEFGDEFQAVPNEKAARNQSTTSANEKNVGSRNNIGSSELIRLINRNNEVQELNVIVKADVQGSLTSVIDSIKALDTTEVAVRVVSSSVGAINENDLHLAQSAGAIIYGFNIELPSSARQQAARDKVDIRLYKVIYELIDDVKTGLSGLLRPEIVEHDLGRLVVRGIFNTTKTAVICGGEVTKGKLTAPALARVTRDKEVLGEVEITGLKRGPQEAKEVFEGEMCGLSFTTTKRIDLLEGDHIEVFTREAIQRTL
ncbi:MAG: infB [Candidatus Saccharibacteria bacterium]|nr:infB [Candidatus Saccharibacteria bacterium]